MSGQVQVFSSIVQYVAMQRETNNNHLRKSPQSAVRCLFGVPDHRETKLLIEEELRKQRDSFFRKWDFNIENFRSLNESKPTNENSRKRSLENDENDIENPAKRLSFADEKLASINGDENIAAVPRRVLQPRNDTQRQITGKCKYSINIIVILIYSLSYNLVYNYSRN